MGDESLKNPPKTLEELYGCSDALASDLASENTRALKDAKQSYYERVREKLEALDPTLGAGGWTIDETRDFIKENQRLIQSRIEGGFEDIRKSLDDPGELELEQYDSWDQDLLAKHVGVVVEGFRSGLEIPLASYIKRYNLDSNEFLAILCEEGYKLRQDSNQETSDRIFSSMKTPDIFPLCESWLGPNGPKLLQERRANMISDDRYLNEGDL